MKAITITQQVKDNNRSFKSYPLGIKIFTTLPNKFCGTENVTGSYQNRTDLHEEDGFWNIEKLPLGEHQKYGAIEQKGNENLYHYPIENYTQEEIEQIEKTAKRTERNRLLKEGVILSNGDSQYWFDLQTLNDFTTNIQLTEKLGGSSISWQSTNKTWEVIALQEAYVMAATGAQMFQQIYIDN